MTGAADAVLVLRRGGLGDCLLMLPLLRALRRARPGAALHFAGASECGELFCRRGVVDAARAAEDLELWHAERARQRLLGYREIVGDEPTLATVPIDVTRVVAGVPVARQWLPQAGLPTHWPDDGWLAPPRACRGPGVIVLAPGSGARVKCWPPVRWLELAALLADRGRALQVVVGPVELERDDPQRWPWPVPVTFVVGRRVTELAAELEAAAAFVGNDSGTTHLAAAVGTPTVALFGPTEPVLWAPVGPHVRVLRGAAGELAAIPAADVAAAVIGPR
ncbi:MAG: hypothetical protein IT455_12355 [Planctomycetes bacterium]|nr:hypothetical protein [Planctomycetota bacterium]